MSVYVGIDVHRKRSQVAVVWIAPPAIGIGAWFWFPGH
jgi:hypothetical protein